MSSHTLNMHSEEVLTPSEGAKTTGKHQMSIVLKVLKRYDQIKLLFPITFDTLDASPITEAFKGFYSCPSDQHDPLPRVDLAVI